MRIKRIQSEEDKLQGRYFEFDIDSKPLGQGGMGVVYRGERVDERQGIRTEVAIKVLADGLPAEVYARAQREASIRIKHANLVEMYGLITEYERDCFGTQVTRHYVISELLHGLNLSDFLSGSFDNTDGSENIFAKSLFNKYMHDREETSVHIIRDIASGVLALHDRGYIHRDIDPSNIMVTSDGCIKLIDFGIAKSISKLNTRDDLTTSTGVFIGKAEYASPELVLGDVQNQNYGTDIYALGILLYRLLVGKLPFEGSRHEILQAQLKKRIPARNIESPGLEKVVRKATAKTQRDRYGTIAEFRVAIDHAMIHPGIRIPKWVYGIAASVALVAIGYGAVELIPDQGHGPVTEPPIEPRPEMTIEDQFNRALTLLNNPSEADSVARGFELMKGLAMADCDEAKIEIGLTYNPYPLDTQTDSRSPQIRNRRRLLGLKDAMRSEADSVVKYLDELAELPPEALYVLGATQYMLTEDKNKALPHFQQAQRLIERHVPVGHEYDSSELARKLNTNIETLRQAR